MTDKIWDIVKDAAPTLAGLAVGGPFAPIAASIVSKAIGAEDDTEGSIAAAMERIGPEKAAAALKQAEQDRSEELALMAEQNRRTLIEETNKTARAEINSNDPYVRGWRPAFGYAVKNVFLIQVGGSSIMVLIAIITEALGGIDKGATVEIINAIAAMIGATTVIWGFALSVLGVNISSRSKDKAVSAGQPPPSGVLGDIITKLVK